MKHCEECGSVRSKYSGRLCKRCLRIERHFEANLRTAEAALAQAVALLREAALSCGDRVAYRIDAFLASAKADERKGE